MSICRYPNGPWLQVNTQRKAKIQLLFTADGSSLCFLTVIPHWKEDHKPNVSYESIETITWISNPIMTSEFFLRTKLAK